MMISSDGDGTDDVGGGSCGSAVVILKRLQDSFFLWIVNCDALMTFNKYLYTTKLTTNKYVF